MSGKRGINVRRAGKYFAVLLPFCGRANYDFEREN